MPSLEWEVDVPSSRAATGTRPRRAIVRITTPERGEEDVTVPLAVGRRLASARRAGTFDPASRAELLHKVGSLGEACAHERMEYLLGRRDYSAQELARKLDDDGYAPQVVSALVERCRHSGLLDDARFAGAFARSKASLGWGSRKIAFELRRRGVADDVIEGCLEDALDGSSERERALEAARARSFTGRDPFARAVRFLCGRGFSMGVALDVAREVTGAGRDAV